MGLFDPDEWGYISSDECNKCKRKSVIVLNDILHEMADKTKRLNNKDTINGILGAMNIVMNKIVELGGEVEEIRNE